MKELRVPQRTVPVHVRLQDGEECEGVLYTALSGPDGGPARLIDRLNDPAERFLPFAAGDRRELLHKARIVWVRLDAQEPTRDDQAPHEERVAVTLQGGAVLEGLVDYVMPPSRGRLLDYLNAAPQFVELITRAGTVLVNRDFMARVKDLGES